jgi:hypothetical protein
MKHGAKVLLMFPQKLYKCDILISFLLHFRVAHSFRGTYLSVLRFRGIAYNAPAAWRSGGFH